MSFNWDIKHCTTIFMSACASNASNKYTEKSFHIANLKYSAKRKFWLAQIFPIDGKKWSLGATKLGLNAIQRWLLSCDCLASLLQKIVTVSFWPPPPVKATKQPWKPDGCTGTALPLFHDFNRLQPVKQTWSSTKLSRLVSWSQLQNLQTCGRLWSQDMEVRPPSR